MHRGHPCPRLIKPNQPTPTQRGITLASRMHCQNSSCPPHARSTSTLADVHGLQARSGNRLARDWKDTRRNFYGTDEGEPHLRPAMQHTISRCQPLWPPTITHLSQALRRFRCVLGLITVAVALLLLACCSCLPLIIFDSKRGKAKIRKKKGKGLIMEQQNIQYHIFLIMDMKN